MNRDRNEKKIERFFLFNANNVRFRDDCDYSDANQFDC